MTFLETFLTYPLQLLKALLNNLGFILSRVSKLNYMIQGLLSVLAFDKKETFANFNKPIIPLTLLHQNAVYFIKIVSISVFLS